MVRMWTLPDGTLRSWVVLSAAVVVGLVLTVILERAGWYVAPVPFAPASQTVMPMPASHTVRVLNVDEKYGWVRMACGCLIRDAGAPVKEP